MQGDFIFGGNIRFVSEFKTKNGKKIYRFIDEDTGKVIKVFTSGSSLNGNAGDFSKYVLKNLRFYKNTFDVLELAGEYLEGYEDRL